MVPKGSDVGFTEKLHNAQKKARTLGWDGTPRAPNTALIHCQSTPNRLQFSPIQPQAVPIRPQ